jgi:Zn-dependent peptidase ImmA (M78 family)
MGADSTIQLDLMDLADIGQPVKLAHEIHRQLRAQFGTVPLKIPLPGIAETLGIVGIREFDTDDFEGTLVVQNGFGAIGLRKGLRSGRRNFTLGHEIGHMIIPNHRLQKSDFQCAPADMSRERESNWDKRPVLERIEVEANEFSAALLVPLAEFQIERRRLGSALDVAHVRHLAETFDVSQEMMAAIYVKTSDEKVAIITSHNGKVRRVIPCNGFPYLGLRRDAPIPPGTITKTLQNTEEAGSVSELREMATHSWLERKGSVSALYEQVFTQESGWAMTLLTVDEDEVDENEDDTNWNRRNIQR